MVQWNIPRALLDRVFKNKGKWLGPHTLDYTIDKLVASLFTISPGLYVFTTLKGARELADNYPDSAILACRVPAGTACVYGCYWHEQDDAAVVERLIPEHVV